MKQELTNFLREQGFLEIRSTLPEFSFFFHLENHYVNVIQVVQYNKNVYIPKDQYELMKDKIKDFFREKNIAQVHILSLIMSEDREKAVDLSNGDRFSWILDEITDRLEIPTQSVEDFYGMKAKFLEFLGNPQRWQTKENEEEESEQIQVKSQYKAYINYALVGINIALFFITSMTGDLLYDLGMLTASGVLAQGEYYRLFTSMFLHAGIDHLLNNMIILLFLGNLMEEHMGHIKYLIVYLIGGIGGGMVSLYYQSLLTTETGSVGASGAIFGLFGALLMFTIFDKEIRRKIAPVRMILVIALMIYNGFTMGNVDNAAHIGGLITGFLLAGILVAVDKIRKKEGLF